MLPVLAQIDPPTFEYAVVETCPAEADARRLFPAAVGTTRVVVWFDGRSFGGRVTFFDPDYLAAERTLSGPSCKVVLEALALSMGVALDAASKKEPAGPSYVVEPPEPVPLPAPPPPRTASFLRGADLGVAAWVGGQPAPAVAASLTVVVGSSREEHGVWAPRVRLGYAASFPTRSSGEQASAFYSFIVRFDGCPASWPRAGHAPSTPSTTSSVPPASRP